MKRRNTETPRIEGKGTRKKGEKRGCAEGKSRSPSPRLLVSPSLFIKSLRLCVFVLLFVVAAFAQSPSASYEDRAIAVVDVAFLGADRDLSAAEQLRVIARAALGERYSAVRVRESLQALYESGKIVSAQVEAAPVGDGGVSLRFIVKRKTLAETVQINVGTTVGDRVTDEELLLRLNLLNPGTAVTEQTLRGNADAIQSYLRERGFYNAEVTYRLVPTANETRVGVAFQVNPGAQARVENFTIAVKGFDAEKIRKDLKLKPGENFSRGDLTEDVAEIRRAVLDEGYLAPRLEDPNVTFDAEKNAISIELKGEVGPKVNVEVNAGKDKLGAGTLTRILPVKREGTLEQSAIIEGERRLRNYYQERGYFFADVQAVCSVKPDFPKDETSSLENETVQLCAALSGADLEGRDVTVSYNVELNRRLRLEEIRIEGTDKITVADVTPILRTQRASLLGLIPRLGYGRGYTSNEILAADRSRIQSVMRELGYRNAQVTVRQGVSTNGEDLIITFVVNEGIPTTVSDVDIVGNNVFSDQTLEAALPNLVGRNYSRARTRTGVQKISEIYAREGFYDARVTSSIVELPDAPDAAEDRVKIVYNVENEGKKVFINRVLINGNEITKRGAIVKALNLREGDVLRAADIFTSEQNLYSTDAFLRVEIRPEPAGETPDGNRLTDVVVTVEEQKPRIVTYGGGFSTDEGALGFFDIRDVNLFGTLQQGGARVRMSRRQQLIQLDYLNPRFLPEGRNRYAPLSITLQYQRDSTITRFFRSSLDRGTQGIVQRIDEEGNPIDVFGNATGDPTINRFTATAETSRTLSEKARSILFLRYRYEDVRLFNIESLLIADLLRPDERVRISGFGATFVRDTRQNCSRRVTLLEVIQKGDPGEPCRYNPSDPTRGSYLTTEYNFSAPQLGANIGFHKFQANFQTYYQIRRFRNTVLAGRGILGLASVFSRKNTFADPQLQELNGLLPVSERFFAGGSTTLRGFGFEEAGPRAVVVPQGTFRNQDGEIVALNPFLVPFGGNALAITNLEARIPLTDSIQAVPFYDGGNVFRRVGDIFKPLPQATGDVFRDNLRAAWTHTIGLGFRIKTPLGGSVAVDYGFLLNAPQFLIPQPDNTNTVFQPKRGQLHFRFAQTF